MTVTPNYAIARLAEIGRKITEGLCSTNPEVREMAEIANGLAEILYDATHGSHKPQEGK